MKKIPDVINITFTEKDRQNAGDYQSTNDCLMATALKRMGYNHNTLLEISGFGITNIDGIVYRPAENTPFGANVQYSGRRTQKPFYKQSVVGQTVTLIRERSC